MSALSQPTISTGRFDCCANDIVKSLPKEEATVTEIKRSRANIAGGGNSLLISHCSSVQADVAETWIFVWRAAIPGY